ncbi:MAG: hypothetical protein ABEH61_00675 [Haloarculaceae archaeon]
MVTSRETLEYLGGLFFGGVVLAGLVVPEALLSPVVRVRQGLSVPSGLAGTVVTGGLLIAGTVVWLGAMWLLARGISTVWARGGGRVAPLVGAVVPKSPLVRLATGAMLLLLLVLIVIGVLPVFLESVGVG